MNIKDVTPAQLDAWLVEHGQKPFRKKQIHEWLFKNLALDFQEMKNLPAALRNDLAADFTCSALTELQRLVSEDKTVKWLLQLQDGNTIETVLIKTPTRNTVCISTQVGCQVHCLFCASGKKGFIRNLTTAEIIDQVIIASREAGKLVSNIVVMGMGEPLHNFNNLVEALDTICSPDGLGLGARHITVSTSGVPNGIRQLAQLQRPWNLAVSLHAVNDAIRAKLIPPRQRAKIAEILDAARQYRELTGRMVTLEYILIDGINASTDDAIQLADIAKSLHAKVNLIPSNTDDPRFPPPAPEQSQSFLDTLLKHHVQATLRLRKGKDIQAACGQLRRRYENDQQP